MRSPSKRKRKKVCLYHKTPFRECPSNCGFAAPWRMDILSVMRRRKKLSEARLRRREKAALSEANRIAKAAKAAETPLKRPEKLINKILRHSHSCPTCSSRFISRYAIYCSKECRPKSKGRTPGPKVIRECQQCSKPFELNRPSDKRRFCSNQCFGKSRATEKVAVVRPDSKCVTCGCVIAWPKTRFCSKKCNKVEERKIDKILGRKKPAKKKDRKVFQPKPCVECDELFVPKNDGNVYCSRKCHLRATRRKTRLRNKGKPEPIHQRVKDRLSGRLRELLRRKGLQKQNAINSYTGCSPKEMVRHIESQFTDGMNWGNYGVFGWHLDHIIPCSRFDLSKEEHCSVCFNWRNIRPLWGEKNYMRQDMLSLDEALQLDPELVRMANEAGVRLW